MENVRKSLGKVANGKRRKILAKSNEKRLKQLANSRLTKLEGG